MKQALIQYKTLFRKWYLVWSNNTLIAKQLATQTGLKRISQQVVDQFSTRAAFQSGKSFGQQVVAQLVQLLGGMTLIQTHHDFNSLEFEGFRKEAGLNALIAENLAKVKLP